jgi:general secretion pathway protein E
MSRQGQLAYSFAKRHGVLLVKQGESQEQGLLLREDVKLSTLMEVRRSFWFINCASVFT